MAGRRLRGHVFTLRSPAFTYPSTAVGYYGLNYLLAKLTVGKVMTHNPFTVTTDTPIQQAASIMLAYKVSGLQVVDREARPIGIITETDIFRMLVDQWDYFVIQHADPGFVATLIAEQMDK